MFRILTAVAVNAGMLGYAGFWRKKHVDDVYANLDKDSQKKIYDNCPVQKYPDCRDALSAIQERILTNNPSFHEQDKPLKPFK